MLLTAKSLLKKTISSQQDFCLHTKKNNKMENKCSSSIRSWETIARQDLW